MDTNTNIHNIFFIFKISNINNGFYKKNLIIFGAYAAYACHIIMFTKINCLTGWNNNFKMKIRNNNIIVWLTK